ncbi:MAG TPA: glycoside hydrolase family 2 TIM barrel-domain containing protein [Prolixibacteraceae bacterium]|nr:glycoside hydrolase family 2 TIM barrel-domain containing protein [Prolixibacteraceae bacterium]
MKNILFIMMVLAVLTGCKTKSGTEKSSPNGPKKVEVREKEGKYRLYVDGKEFYIKGAGCEFGDVASLAKHGANSFRTWRTENGKQSGKEVLDEAQKNGLLVTMGLEISRERHGFDYNNTDSVKAQLEYVKGEVEKYKNHPALLAWGIGNELNLGANNMKVWDAVNEISKMIHQIDPNHPTTTMLSGIGKKEIDYIKEHGTDLDFICIQMYADIENLQKRIADAGYNGPYVVTEWGATGHWEVQPTTWNAPVEQTSHEKQNSFLKRYDMAIAADPNHCMGSYVFLWGQKQERTPTWYGMFLESGEETETVDAMHKIWTGNWPENRCPALDSLRINGKKIYDMVYLKPGEKFKAVVVAHDQEGDTLTYRWEILPESTDLKWGGDKESRPETLLHQTGEATMKIKAPQTEGAYRLFSYVTDGHNHAATANFPFFVKK